MTIKVLLVSANYPDKFHLWGPWNKEANIAISKLISIDTEIIVPRPYVLPFYWFPHNEINLLPITERDIEGTIHHPRFLYCIPKTAFYPIIGDLYRYSVSKYITNAINDFDLIHSHHAYPDGYGLVNLSKRKKVPLIVDIHGEAFFNKWMTNLFLKRKIIKTVESSSKIICISKNMFSLAENCGIPVDKLEYVPLGVNVNLFCGKNKKIKVNETSIESKILILFVGHLTKNKGVYVLLKAISLIDLSYRNKLKLIIIGDGPEKEKMMKLVGKFGVDTEIQFMGEISNKNELANYFTSADIFVLPSFSEGKPTVINEAMASECAIIATNVGGIPEQVLDGYNGYLVESSNSNAIKEKIEYLINNHSILEKMKINSRKRVLEEGWTWENYAKKVFSLYQDVLDGS